MDIYIISDKVINLIRDANVFISYGKRFHPLHLIIYFRNNILFFSIVSNSPINPSFIADKIIK